MFYVLKLIYIFITVYFGFYNYFWTFYLLHIGHINMLNKCKKYRNKLIVGVLSDNLNLKKNRYPIFKQEDRI